MPSCGAGADGGGGRRTDHAVAVILARRGRVGEARWTLAAPVSCDSGSSSLPLNLAHFRCSAATFCSCFRGSGPAGGPTDHDAYAQAAIHSEAVAPRCGDRRQLRPHTHDRARFIGTVHGIRDPRVPRPETKFATLDSSPQVREPTPRTIRCHGTAGVRTSQAAVRWTRPILTRARRYCASRTARGVPGAARSMHDPRNPPP
jgi:hypothetical protein